MDKTFYGDYYKNMKKSTIHIRITIDKGSNL